MVELAATDNLPMDMTGLDISPIVAIIKHYTNEDDRINCIANAHRILVATSSCSVEEQIDLIAKYRDDEPDSYIDNISGVTVWRSFEFTYRVEDFLYIIGYTPKP